MVQTSLSIKEDTVQFLTCLQTPTLPSQITKVIKILIFFQRCSLHTEEYACVCNRALHNGNILYLLFFTLILFYLFFSGARTNDHQLPKFQKITLPKSLDVDSARRAIRLLFVCRSQQKPFILFFTLIF